MGILSALSSPMSTLTRLETACSEEVEHTPTATPWTQEGTLKGGRRWELELSAGQRTRITSNYKIVLSSREEIIGGNRRD